MGPLVCNVTAPAFLPRYTGSFLFIGFCLIPLLDLGPINRIIMELRGPVAAVAVPFSCRGMFKSFNLPGCNPMAFTAIIAEKSFMQVEMALCTEQLTVEQGMIYL